jgi:hypothetical protein
MNAVLSHRLSWARLVSNLCSPPVVLSFLAWFAARYDAQSTDEALFLAALFIVGAVLIPFGILGWWVYRGTVSDIHMSLRHERYWPLALEAACTFVVWILLHLVGHYPAVYLVTSYLLVETLMGLAVTYYWQISIHAGIMAGAVVIAGLLFGAAVGFTLSPLILLVAAARLRLKKHTVGQVIAGIAIGVIAPPLLYMLIMPSGT